MDKEKSKFENKPKEFDPIGKSIILRHGDGRLFEGRIVWLGFSWIVVKTTMISKEPNKTLGFHADQVAHFEIIEKKGEEKSDEK